VTDEETRIADGPSSSEESADPDELVAQDIEELDAPDPHPEPVVYSGTDFDIEGLVRRLDRGDIVIPTFGRDQGSIETERFQREFVWNRTQMDRFIESLLLGYPIPGIFLVQQADKRYLVLDGQQRLRTLADFYRGDHLGKPFELRNVADRFQGLTYGGLTEDQRRGLDNTFIQATIVKTDGSAASLDSVYQVFERLNSGGTQLTPHEIRVALYAGPLIEYLTQLNRLPNWRQLYGPESPRLRDQELLLRVVALYVSPGTYRRPLKRYLNDFVAAHRDLDPSFPSDTVRTRFDVSTALLVDPEGPGRSALRSGSRQVNAALAEAVLVGLFRRLDGGPDPPPAAIKAATESLLVDGEFQRAISRATADEEAVRTRLAIGTAAFAQL
jgi:hypothetical protein